MKLLAEIIRSIIHETIEESIDDQIEDMRAHPEFKSLNAFIEAKLNDDVFDYDFMELHALGRNITQLKMGKKMTISEASPGILDQIKTSLKDMGFTFVGRQPVKKTRGFKSSAHGTHPFAGSGGGGSGFGSDFGGTTFTSFGGGAGAVGGGYSWNADDKKNLPMGSKRKR